MQESQVTTTTNVSPPQLVPFEELARSVARRARIVFAIAIGFYLYALFIPAAFLAVGFLLTAVINSTLPGGGGLLNCLVLPVILFALATAVLIIWSLIPRLNRFTAPGPKLDLKDQPKLLEAASDVAQRTSQPMPAEVYIMLDVNAAVTERGGIAGMRKRRVLILGLPLFSILTIQQFRAVLAHEFGHFYWGDTRLGPWLRRAHHAIHNTIETLEQAQYTAWINLLLFGYAEWFLDVSHDLMRKQEFLADQLAAKIAGPKAAIEGLQLLHVGDDAFEAYWNRVVSPMNRFGVRLPIFEGFRRFLAAQGMSGSILRKADTRMKEDKTEYYDTHPALPERVAALAQLRAGDLEAGNNAPATTLLSNVEELENTLLIKVLGKDRASKLRLVSWDDALAEAYLPMWEDTVRSYAPGLEGLTPEALPDVVKTLSVFGTQMLKRSNRSGEFDSLSERMSTVIGSALAVALHRMGWELRTSPGEPVYAYREGRTVEPFDVLGKLVARKLSAEEWRRQCDEAGITGLDLGKLQV